MHSSKKFSKKSSKRELRALTESLIIWLEARGFEISYSDFECNIYATTKNEEYLGSKSKFRCIRILDAYKMQICDGNFDRWANSVGAEITAPKSEDELDNALKALKRAARVD